MVLTKSKTEIKEKIKKLCAKKDAYTSAPGGYTNLQNDIKELTSYTRAEFGKEYKKLRAKMSIIKR